MFRSTGTNREYTEGFVEYIKEIDSVDVACILRETEGDRVKVSMRSKRDVDVAVLAQRFGGGGHRRAAGCTMEGSMNDVKNKLIGALSL
jgi:bifunctional oligoribonuclease and PAP phosphatase NrnA